MRNVTKVTTAGSALEVSLSTYGLKDVTDVKISWNIGGSVDNKGKSESDQQLKVDTICFLPLITAQPHHHLFKRIK